MQWKAMVAALGLAAAAAGPAQAGPAHRVEHVQVAMLPPPPQSCETGTARVDGWLGELERRLQLAAEQKPAWTAFAEGARAADAPMRTLCAAAPPSPPELSDPAGMMVLQERFETSHLESTRLMRAAVEQLAAALSVEQRARLGQALMPPPLPPMHAGPGGRPMPPRP